MSLWKRFYHNECVHTAQADVCEIGNCAHVAPAVRNGNYTAPDESSSGPKNKPHSLRAWTCRASTTSWNSSGKLLLPYILNPQCTFQEGSSCILRPEANVVWVCCLAGSRLQQSEPWSKASRTSRWSSTRTVDAGGVVFLGLLQVHANPFL